jgi:glycine/sarcosine N-methyltransferase
MKSDQNLEQFYDSLAGEYDEMTGFEDRLSKEKPLFQSLVQKYHITAALDAGCGTGFQSILLAQLGVQVTATDISEHMLQRTKENAERKGVLIETVHSSFRDIKKNVKKTYDAIFCLGNSLPHILEEKELFYSLKGFYEMMDSDGRLFIHVLNYHRILKNQVRIQNIKERDGKIFIRFYDYTGETLLFNVLTIQRQEGTMKHSLRSIRLYPWCSADLIRIVKDAGYGKVQTFGSMSLDAYDELISKDVVMIAGR